MQNSSIDFSKKYTIGFVVFMLVFFIVLESYTRLYLIENDDDSRRIANVYRAKTTKIIIGDSHTRRAFAKDVHLNSHFINLSRGGTNIKLMDLIVREYYRYRDVGTVVILASPHMFAEYRLEGDLQGHDLYYTHNNPWGTYSAFFEPGLSKTLKGLKSNEYENKWSEVDEKERYTKTSERVKLQMPPEVYKLTKDYQVYVNLLSYLKDRGGQVVLLRTPVTQKYLDVADKYPIFKEIENDLINIAATLNCVHVDFRDLPMSYTNDKFCNQDHLNVMGGNEFRQVFFEYLKEINFK